jgi:hypothetical protein
MEESLILTSCTEHITRGERPHAGKELGKSTVEECHTNSGIWNGNVASVHVVK